ncbi:hypothetical protein PIROE2DRAFT_7034, partial [Piromyces sp. E2]
ECPFGSICGSNSVCTYGYFLYQSNVVSKPILKTCHEEQAEKEICSTNNCENDNDCYSGKCDDGVCINNTSTIYLCKGRIDNTNNVFKCGKQNQMKCVNNNDCYDNLCNSETGLCENSDNSTLHRKYNSYKKWKTAAIPKIVCFRY